MMRLRVQVLCHSVEQEKYWNIYFSSTLLTDEITHIYWVPYFKLTTGLNIHQTIFTDNLSEVANKEMLQGNVTKLCSKDRRGPAHKFLQYVWNHGFSGCSLPLETPFYKELWVLVWDWRMTLHPRRTTPCAWDHSQITNWCITYSLKQEWHPINSSKENGTMWAASILESQQEKQAWELIHHTGLRKECHSLTQTP